MNQITRAAALAVTALTMATTTSPAAAGTKPSSTSETTESAVTCSTPPAPRTSAARSLPATGSCEPATNTLEAVGEVCGDFPDATYAVNQRFVGRYGVTDASSRRLRGTDGWISLILATKGRANVEAIDT